MAVKVGINGYGRIGRNVLRALYESGRKDVQIVAINDLGPAETNAHLTRYDTAHGPFPGTVAVEGEYLVVNGDKIKVLANRDPAKLAWGELGVDVVLECTGFFTSKAKASAHLAGGAKKVVISAPGGNDVDATIVYGVPPMLRLTTLAFNQVPKDLLELGAATGASPRSILFKIEIPSATPTLIVGLNQCILLSLAMVVLAGLVGAGGLGAEVTRGLTRMEMGLGLRAGLSIVAIAILLDRVSRGALQRRGRRGAPRSTYTSRIRNAP